MASTPVPRPVRALVHYPGRGELTGGPRSVLLLLDALRSKGLETVLLTEEEGPLTEKARPLVDAVWVQPLRRRPNGAGAARSGLGITFLGALRTVPGVLRFMWALFRRLRREPVDVIWTRATKGVLLVGPLATLSRTRLVWDVDLEFPSEGIYAVVNRVCLAMSDLVVTQSSHHRDELFRRFSDTSRARVRAILPPVPPARVNEIREAAAASAPAGSGRTSILMVGTISPRKNQRVAVQALSQLRSRMPQARLEMVGPCRDTRYLAMVMEDVERLGLTGHVHFHGWQDDALSYMASSDVLLVPSVAEGVPHVVREAMLLGLPVVASSVGGMPDLVRDGVTGWLVDHTRPEEIAVVLERCLSDPLTRTRIASAAAAFAAERLDAESWSTKYTGLILDVARREGP